jgi:hypothetical protein
LRSASPESFADCADRHKVSGLAYRALSSLESEDVYPGCADRPEVLAALRRDAAGKAAVTSAILSEWKRIEGEFRRSGIRVLIIKGPALSLELYGDPREREYRDLDLLIDSSSMAKAQDILFSFGYEHAEDIDGLSPRFRDFVLMNGHHWAFKKRDRPVFIEIHGVAGSSIGLAPIPVEEAFLRAATRDYDGVSYPSLCREHHALLALLHGAKHQWCTLQWFLDCAVILSDGSLDLPRRPATPNWRGPDPGLCLQAFEALADRLIETPRIERYRPASRHRPSRARYLARASAGRLEALGSAPGRNKHRIMLQGTVCDFLSSSSFPSCRDQIRSLFRPNTNDFHMMPGRDLPLWLYYFARPPLVVARIILRTLRSSNKAA